MQSWDWILFDVFPTSSVGSLIFDRFFVSGQSSLFGRYGEEYVRNLISSQLSCQKSSFVFERETKTSHPHRQSITRSCCCCNFVFIQNNLPFCVVELSFASLLRRVSSQAKRSRSRVVGALSSRVECKLCGLKKIKWMPAKASFCLNSYCRCAFVSEFSAESKLSGVKWKVTEPRLWFKLE